VHDNWVYLDFGVHMMIVPWFGEERVRWYLEHVHLDSEGLDLFLLMTLLLAFIISASLNE
jgi:hypothetical protein